MSILYYGIPAAVLGSAKPVVRFTDTSIPAAKRQRNNLPIVGSSSAGYGWGKAPKSKAMCPEAATLALALCTHALADSHRAARLYQRFKMRVMEKWDAEQSWAITAAEICATCDQIEDAQKSMEKAVVAAERELPFMERDAGPGVDGNFVVWDTDENGRRIRQRGED